MYIVGWKTEWKRNLTAVTHFTTFRTFFCQISVRFFQDRLIALQVWHQEDRLNAKHVDIAERHRSFFPAKI